ncbi:MAG TPA: PBP1A family penicillin-binding protein, partial [Firmicutes bacterium]|nr:PBP1A family penicillin-binding protein [Bacillota bacterium]
KLKRVVAFSILSFFAALGVIAGIVIAFTQEVPEIADLRGYKPNLSTAIYDVNNTLVSQVFTERRTLVKLQQVPDHLLKALLAKEDPNFYIHNGIDFRGVIRAAYNNFVHRKIVEGGSTITQQLAKNLFLTAERNFTRKIKEALLALQIEKYYTKDEILELYLNQIYFGSGAYGIEAATRTYFGKHVEEITLAESALLAMLPQAPSARSPYRNLDLALEKRDLVIEIMAERGVITETEKLEALAEPITLGKLEVENAPYFVEYIRRRLEGTYGTNIIYKGGLRVYTTIDSQLQETAQRVFARHIARLEQQIQRSKKEELKEPLQGALLAMDPNTGHIKAMIGGIDYSKSEFNRAVQAKRQTGSAFKPIVYTAAVDNGFRVCDIIMDSPIVFDNSNGSSWKPENFSGKFTGPMLLLNGLAQSQNVVAVKVLDKVGIGTTQRYARRMGIESALSNDLTLALGSASLSLFEMVNSFCTLANGGMKVEPMSVLQVKDSEGKILEQHNPRLTSAIKDSTAYIVTFMLENVINRGTGRRVRNMGFQGPAAGKTGTTNEFTDAWFIGYTPDLVVGVWVGFDSKDTMGKSIVGGSAAAPIWTDFMLQAFEKSEGHFPVPDSIIYKKICLQSGFLAAPGCRAVIDAPFVEGTEPHRECTIHSGMQTGSFLNTDFESFDDFSAQEETAAETAPRETPAPKPTREYAPSIDNLLNF